MAEDFPDLTGDGQVTRADVLKGRGVFKRGGKVQKFGPRYGFKRFAEGGKMQTGTAKRNPKSPPLSDDVEADLKALETLEQPDYEVGGPKRRYRKGKVKRYADEGYKSGGSVSSASKRADGCAVKGKTRGKFV